MACMPAFAETTAMATTQLARGIEYRVIQYPDTDSWRNWKTTANEGLA